MKPRTLITVALLVGALRASLPASDTLVPTSADGQPPGSARVLQASTLTSMDALDDKYRLAIGDQLSFRILEDQEDPKPLVVTDSGDLEVPYIGRFPALDKTCRALARELKTELEKEYYYQATVILAVDLMTKSRGKVYLVGQVRVPGPQDIPSDEVLTLGKAVLRAGGFADFADKKKVKITRQVDGGNAAKTMVINLAEIFEQGKTDKDVPLLPGDMIFVPSRLINF
jgi:polysaccharide export outer membrane protein